jgi:hypothetical protein
VAVEVLGGVDAAPARPREPEKLRLPAGAVQYLLALALRTELGGAWWDGFRTAHGAPAWLTPGRVRVATDDAALLPLPAAGEGD